MSLVSARCWTACGIKAPIDEVPKHLVNEAMHRLEHGRVTGRVVLTDPD